MAKRISPDSPLDSLDTDDAPEDQAPEPTKAKAVDDVLVYVDRMGALVTHWNEPTREGQARVGGLVIPVSHRCRLEPGLSFCPGAKWPHVRGTEAWTHRVKHGAIRAVAGQGGDLKAEWAKIKPAALVGMLSKTFHVPALERLKALEASLDRPRVEVAAEIDARLVEMGEKVKASGEARRTQRRRNRQVLG